MKLLIVDDSELVSSRLAKLLQGIPEVSEIQAVDSLAEVVWSVQRGAPDLLILGVYLLDANALLLIETLKKSVPDMQIVILSNDASDFNRKACLKAGGDWFFDKSIEFEQVVEMVRNLASGVQV